MSALAGGCHPALPRECGNHGEGVPGSAQQLPSDVFQIHGDSTWQPHGGRESASIDAFLERRKGPPRSNTLVGTKS
jgi:hypothetical protein